MSSIPLPALGVQAPQQPDVMQGLSKLLQIRNMMGQQQIQKQTIDSNALSLQQQKRDLQDQQTIMETAAAHGGSLVDALPELASKISAKTFIPLQKSIIDTQKAYADKTKVELENEKSTADQLLGLTGQAKQLPGDQYQQMWPQIAQRAMEIKPELKGHIDPTRPIPQQSLDALALGFATHSQLADAQLKQAEAAKNSTDALLNQNKLDVISAWKQNPQQVLAQVDTIVPPRGQNAALNQRTKSQVQFALGNGDVEGAKAAIKQAAEQVGAIEKDIAVATNPQIQQGKVAVATAEGQARANIEAQIARGSNAALAQVPPHLVAPASAAATKAGEDYAQAQSVSQRLQAMMDAARKGNVVSYQLIPQEGALLGMDAPVSCLPMWPCSLCQSEPPP